MTEYYLCIQLPGIICIYNDRVLSVYGMTRHYLYIELSGIICIWNDRITPTGLEPVPEARKAPVLSTTPGHQYLYSSTPYRIGYPLPPNGIGYTIY